MDIRVNGDALHIDTEGRSLGQILSELDERLENAGAIIISVKVDGKEMDADELPALADTAASNHQSMELMAESAQALRANALSTLVPLLAAAAESAPGAGRAEAQSTWSSFRQTFDGLFSAEENSFLDLFGTELAAGRPLTNVAKNLSAFFGERLHELEQPAAAMLSAAGAFDTIKEDLAEVSVRMQTGKDEQAMKTMLLAVELLNKTVRILPLYLQSSDRARGLTIGGQSSEDFYGEFNSSLRELADAFEHKDGVLIGDLAEYELLPRLSAFFDAVRAAEARP